MGGCQSSDDTIEVPKKLSLPEKKTFEKMEKHRFALPDELHSKLELVTSNGNVWLTKAK